MDPLIISVCLFVPTFMLSLLGAGRDQILFETRPRARHSVVVVGVVAGLATLVALGFPPIWALALILPGLLGSFLGDWMGHGGWVILRYRIERLLGRD